MLCGVARLLYKKCMGGFFFPMGAFVSMCAECVYMCVHGDHFSNVGGLFFRMGGGGIFLGLPP